jgi:broad specificity phosphatase PhoE
MPELWLVRHGQTDWNLEGRYQGQADVPLNSAGRAQAQALAVELAGKQFEAIYSSDLARARETAAILAAPHGLPVRVDPRLREICQGDWEGMPATEICERYGMQIDPSQPTSPDFRAPGGESVREVADRASEAIQDIRDSYPSGAVLIVSHAITTAVVACKARGISLSLARSIIPKNAEAVRVKWPFSDS